MTGHAFGDRVQFTRHLVRRSESRRAGNGHAERWKVWTPVPGPLELRKGVVVGIRHLANGRAEYEYEAGVQWHHGTAERFTAYLIAYDLHRRPVLVLPEHIVDAPSDGTREAVAAVGRLRAITENSGCAFGCWDDVARVLDEERVP